jgi:molybdate transport system ATP-binding protein
VVLRVTAERAQRGFTLAVSFQAPSPGITVVFGPSGSGKTSLLHAIAGLRRADHTVVDLDGEILSRKPVERRRIGMVFQDGRLFPHRTVKQNLVYGLKRAPSGTITPGAVVELLGLGDLLGRYPANLSGGERQRVAIGRALLSQPRLLLMDEPLASLDAARKAEILPYLLRLREILRLPVIYVTHAMEEVVRLADYLVLLEGGRVVASGVLSEMTARVDLPLAARDDAAAVLTGYVHSHEPERRVSLIACGGQVFTVPKLAMDRGSLVRLRIPAREVMIAVDQPGAISVSNIIPSVICAIGQDEAGHAALVELDVGGGQLLARITLDAAERLYLRPGQRVLALIKSMSIEVMAA